MNDTDAISRLQAARERGAAARPRVGGFPCLTEHGNAVVQGEPLVTGFAVAPPFARAGLIAALRADQSGETTFREFVRGRWAAGIVRYDVDTAARTCTYYGADGASYTEDYPAVVLP
ncbi:DUF1398 family protein [Streptomyces yangpuensis]|uniref:DUF1398 family protein n=1 Tax=Streptomyces yangpuensis TaxID=1648182 RepID=UPI00062987A0|nr:DUF1398 family protein [Streptomyces yangpuensis]